jgi:hypothetical protein
MWVFLCTIFWAISWIVAFFILSLLAVKADSILKDPSVRFYLLSGSIGGAVGGAFLAALLAIYFNWKQKILGRVFVFWFWIVFWYLLMPIFWGWQWSISARNCTCGGELLCFCPPPDPISAAIILLVLQGIFSPQYFLLVPVGYLLLGRIFEYLTDRFFQQKMPPAL